MVFPNLIIAGAPKCGTTTLFDYLNLNSEICGSTIKETRYLIDSNYVLFNQESNYYKSGIEGYKDFFADYKKDRHKIIVEATPDYLYQSTALEVLSNMNPQPKIIFILRKPSKRIFSLFNFAQNNMAVLPKTIDFRNFIRQVKNNGRLLQGKPLLQKSIDQSIYIKYLSRWLKKFNQTNIEIILFENFIKNPAAIIESIVQGFNIDSGFYSNKEFHGKNKTKKIRFQGLHRLKNSISFSFLPIGLKNILLSLYQDFNISKMNFTDNEEEYQDVFSALDLFFEEYNNRLSDRLKLDLSPWKAL